MKMYVIYEGQKGESSLTQIMTLSHYQIELVVELKLDYLLHSYNTIEASSLTLVRLLAPFSSIGKEQVD